MKSTFVVYIIYIYIYIYILKVYLNTLINHKLFLESVYIEY